MNIAAVSFHSAAAKIAFVKDALSTPSAIIDESDTCLVLDSDRAAHDLELARNSPHVYQIR